METVLGKASASLEGATADIALVFASMHHSDSLETIGKAILERGMARHVLGCTAETVIGEDEEVEGASALSVWACELPGVDVQPVRIAPGARGVEELETSLGLDKGPTAGLILLGDPFSFASDPFLKRFGELQKGVPIVGGMASGSQVPRSNRLFLDGEIHDDGASAFALRGKLPFRTVVSQGCRPIGRPLIVTKSDLGWIREIGRRNALEVLQELFEELSPQDQVLVQKGLHIGRVINEYQETFQRGDFLVRNVVGADEAGGIAVSDLIRVGRTIQFHVRDAGTADEDLKALLEAERAANEGRKVVGALLFSCNGRGTRLFDAPDHDLNAIHAAYGPIPVAGLFAMGEIGPVGLENFVHGFTASVVLFEEPA